MNTFVVRRTALVAGPALALVVGAATASARDQVGASNAGIALAIIVVLAALAGRAAGLVTAAVAALSFNFFHTQPYHSLRIHESRDVVIVALLAVLGLVVSDITAWRRRRDTIATHHAAATSAPVRVSALLETDRPISEVWPAIAGAIIDQLSLADCHLERSEHTSLPVIARTGGEGFVLPSQGAAIPVVSGEQVLGHLVVRPRRGITSLWIERRVVVALADHLAIALTYTGHQTAARRS